MLRQKNDDSSPAALIVFIFVTFFACEILVWRSLAAIPDLGMNQMAYWAAICVVVGLPFILTSYVAYEVVARAPRFEFELSIPKDEFSDDWFNVIGSVRNTWMYERSRLGRSLVRIRVQALLLGLMVTAIMSFSVIAAGWSRFAYNVDQERVRIFAMSLGASVLAAFALHLTRLMLRIASQDFNSRMFAWATRSIALVATADIGLFLVLWRTAAATVDSLSKGALLGLFTAVVGDRALEVFIDKAASLFGLQPAKRSESSTLFAITDMTEEDIVRFAEEGVLSASDLAFTPTARLFFNTTHSLQRLIDWQDQALLNVYMGPSRTKALFEQFAIRGAIDLQGISRLALNPDPGGNGRAPQGSPPQSQPPPAPAPQTPASQTPSNPAPQGQGAQGASGPTTHVNAIAAAKTKPSELKAALGKALGLEGAGLVTALLTIYEDEVTRRLRVHWASSVLPPNVVTSTSAPAPTSGPTTSAAPPTATNNPPG